MARKFTQRKSFSEIGEMSIKELRKEYTVLRDIFEKRRKRGEKAGIEQFKIYAPGEWAAVPTLTLIRQYEKMQDLTLEEVQRDLIFRVRELTNLVGTRENGLPAIGTLSISGKRKQKKEDNAKLVKALHEAGYEHISASTLKNFGRFMDEMRKQYGKKLPNSAEMAEFFESLKYNTKRRATQFIAQLWEEYKNNGYEPTYGSYDLFRT